MIIIAATIVWGQLQLLNNQLLTPREIKTEFLLTILKQYQADE